MCPTSLCRLGARRRRGFSPELPRATGSRPNSGRNKSCIFFPLAAAASRLATELNLFEKIAPTAFFSENLLIHARGIRLCSSGGALWRLGSRRLCVDDTLEDTLVACTHTRWHTGAHSGSNTYWSWFMDGMQVKSQGLGGLYTGILANLLLCLNPAIKHAGMVLVSCADCSQE